MNEKNINEQSERTEHCLVPELLLPTPYDWESL